MLNSEPDHGLEVVQTVSRVIATAAEDHAVDTSSGCGRRCTLLQCIGQLDLVATTGRGLCQDLEYRRVQDVAPDHRQVARGVSGVGFLDQPRDANHGSVTVIPRIGVDGGTSIRAITLPPLASLTAIIASSRWSRASIRSSPSSTAKGLLPTWSAAHSTA